MSNCSMRDAVKVLTSRIAWLTQRIEGRTKDGLPTIGAMRERGATKDALKICKRYKALMEMLSARYPEILREWKHMLHFELDGCREPKATDSEQGHPRAAEEIARLDVLLGGGS